MSMAMKQDRGVKRKTPLQLQTLEKFYSGNKYPTQKEMDACAASLGLMYDQVRLWFKDRKRKDQFLSSPSNITDREGHGSVKDAGFNRFLDSMIVNENSSSYRAADQSLAQSTARKKTNNKKSVMPSLGMHSVLQCNSSRPRIQRLVSIEYLLERVFRKDGPPIGIEFDPLPAIPFGYIRCPQPNKVNNAISRKRKERGSPNTTTGYGMGKGLMSVWHASNPYIRSDRPFTNLPGQDFDKENSILKPRMKKTSSSRDSQQAKGQRLQHQKQKVASKKSGEMRRIPVKKKRVVYAKGKNQRETYFSVCKLAADDIEPQELDTTAVLLDDEELELSELQAGPNPLRCSAHLTSRGRNGCPFCKDMLSRFPPESVKMKYPFHTQPWISAPNIVKKLFKVFRFLYTHSARIGVCSFTLDEFAQAFHSKDSLLLGKLHVNLLRLLLSSVEKENTVFLPRDSKNCRYLGFLHAVKQKILDVVFWAQSLNSLTWVEILRHVLVAVGFGPKRFSLRRGTSNKQEVTLLEKHGLRPHTLKGELFGILSDCGSNGLKISELSRSSQVVSLSLPNTPRELEDLIYSTLSSDITLFEKIGPSTFRLRIGSTPQNESSCFELESDNSGSSDDDCECFTSCSGSDEDEGSDKLDSAMYVQSVVKYNSTRRHKILAKHMEIDESYSGEAWLLGLMEGEYSDLSIDEKLDAFIAVVDLIDSVFASQKEELTSISSANNSSAKDHGSGAKIKKSLPSKDKMSILFSGDVADMGAICKSKNSDCIYESDDNVHPSQSIHLGYDRRYNSYWLFLGPCNSNDPGHRRIYFESSEDGHWEMIDTKQGLSSLLSALDCRGTREAHLLASLGKRKTFLADAMDECMCTSQSSLCRVSDLCEMEIMSGEGSSPVSDVDNNIIFDEITHSQTSSTLLTFHLGKACEEKKLRWEELQAFDKWIWNSFYGSLNAVKYTRRSLPESLTHCEICHDLYWRDEKHCRKCHATFELDFDLEERYAVHVATCENTEFSSRSPNYRVLSSQLQALKAAIHAIEIAIPKEALADAWTKSSHMLWGKRLRRSSSLAELFQVVADFVAAIKEEWLHEVCYTSSSNAVIDDIVVLFRSIPQTTSAFALWVVKLDIQVAQHLGRTKNMDKKLS